MSDLLMRVPGEGVSAAGIVALAACGLVCTWAAATLAERAWERAEAPRTPVVAPVAARIVAPVAVPIAPASAPIAAPVAAPALEAVVALQVAPVAHVAEDCAPWSISFASSEIRVHTQEQAPLRQLGAFLAAHPERVATVDGHADGLGSNDSNLSVSQLRARAVAAQLIAAGAKPAQLKLRWFGAFAPLHDGAEDGAENRRVVIRMAGSPCPLAQEGSAP
ncbi:MAG TPA: OmpA family protein [Polyangiales bacterium]